MRRLLLYAMLLVAGQSYSQLHQPVFPGLEGQELLDSVVAAFKAPVLLPQAMARDTLFGKIDKHDDSLSCVYTGFTIWLDPTKDPTQAAFMNGGPDGINTEHTWPQSLGATGLAEGDMHHLFPTRIDVNADRGNSPFADIPDDQTQRWYYLDQQTSTIPTTHIERYSEWVPGLFEPREDHKGNVARAMMYFYTMYRPQADSTFFEIQRQTLCQWHVLDPVDQREWDRTWAIAAYQSGKPNPFVLDCTLAERSWCADAGIQCTVTTAEAGHEGCGFTAYPTPSAGAVNFSWQQALPGRVDLSVYALDGRRVVSFEGMELGAGRQQKTWQPAADLAAGVYVARLLLEGASGVRLQWVRLVLMPH